MLETRLDNVVYRLGFAKPASYSSIVNHGHSLVNGKKVDIPSYQALLEMKSVFVEKPSSRQVATRNLKGPSLSPLLLGLEVNADSRVCRSHSVISMNLIKA